MNVDGFEEEKKAFNLSNVDLMAVSWLNMKTQKGKKNPYLALKGLIIYNANIIFLKLMLVFVALQPCFG